MTKRLFTVVALVLCANALYTPYINRVMFCDEANTLYQYATDLSRALFAYVTPNNHILHSVLVWGVTNLAGTSPVAVRFVALASALLAVALMFRVTARFAGYRAGVAAAVFLMTTLTFANYAVNARGYTLSVALTLLLIDRLFFARSFAGRGYRYSLLAISFALILLLPSMLLLIAALCVWIVWKAQTERRYLFLLPPLIFGVLFASIFYLPTFLQGDVIRQDFSLFGEADMLVLLRLWLDQTFGTPGIGLLFAASCLAGIAVLTRHYPRARVLLITLLGMTVLFSIAQILVLHKLFFARNYLYLSVPVALLGGIGLSRVANRYTVPLLVVVLVASILPFKALDGDYLEKQVVERVEQNVGVNDQIVAAPCFNAPIQYQLMHNGEGEKLFSTPPKQRVFVLLRGQPLDEVLAEFGMQESVTACQPVTDGSWSPFEAYVCKPIP